MNQECCGHVNVVRKTLDYPGGYKSEYWECGCGARFVPENTDQAGARLRDWFAGMALNGMLSANPKMPQGVKTKQVDQILALEAYRSADAMIAERAKPNLQR